MRMIVSAVQNEDSLCYLLTDLTPQLEKVLRDNHYSIVGDGFSKCFRMPVANPEIIKANFLRSADEMFADLANGKPMRWEKGLKHFASIAEEAGIHWWTNGKAALALMGVDIAVDDLDFVFDADDIHLVNEAFKEFIVEPIISTEGTPRDGIVQYYGVAYSHCRICLMFEPYAALDHPEPVHVGQYARHHLEAINWNGYNIKVAPLDLHLQTYKRWGSNPIITQIEDFINRKKQMSRIPSLQRTQDY
jgi:hypothetical protein